jgi:aquaporin Z
MVINKYLAELIGTFILVFVGSLSIVASGGDFVVIAFGFGLALMAAIYAVGDVSGGHFNPAVTLAMWLDKRTDTTDLIGYWIGQVVGGALGSVGILIAADKATVAATYTRHTAIGGGSAFLLETVLTAVFVLVILAVTVRAPRGAPMAISLTLVAIHFAAIPLTGASVNPARTLGPSIIGGVGDGLWVYLLAPLLGAAVAWLLYRLFHTEEATA